MSEMTNEEHKEFMDAQIKKIEVFELRFFNFQLIIWATDEVVGDMNEVNFLLY